MQNYKGGRCWLKSDRWLCTAIRSQVWNRFCVSSPGSHSYRERNRLLGRYLTQPSGNSHLAKNWEAQRYSKCQGCCILHFWLSESRCSTDCRPRSWWSVFPQQPPRKSNCLNRLAPKQRYWSWYTSLKSFVQFLFIFGRICPMRLSMLWWRSFLPSRDWYWSILFSQRYNLWCILLWIG